MRSLRAAGSSAPRGRAGSRPSGSRSARSRRAAGSPSCCMAGGARSRRPAAQRSRGGIGGAARRAAADRVHHCAAAADGVRREDVLDAQVGGRGRTRRRGTSRPAEFASPESHRSRLAIPRGGARRQTQAPLLAAASCASSAAMAAPAAAASTSRMGMRRLLASREAADRAPFCDHVGTRAVAAASSGPLRSAAAMPSRWCIAVPMRGAGEKLRQPWSRGERSTVEADGSRLHQVFEGVQAQSVGSSDDARPSVPLHARAQPGRGRMRRTRLHCALLARCALRSSCDRSPRWGARGRGPGARARCPASTRPAAARASRRAPTRPDRGKGRSDVGRLAASGAPVRAPDARRRAQEARARRRRWRARGAQLLGPAAVPKCADGDRRLRARSRPSIRARRSRCSRREAALELQLAADRARGERAALRRRCRVLGARRQHRRRPRGGAVRSALRARPRRGLLACGTPASRAAAVPSAASRPSARARRRAGGGASRVPLDRLARVLTRRHGCTCGATSSSMRGAALFQAAHRRRADRAAAGCASPRRGRAPRRSWPSPRSAQCRLRGLPVPPTRSQK